MVKVEIEYCEGCGYKPHYEELVRKIQETLPTVEVIGRNGRTGSFEVEVDGELIFSKLARFNFPDFQEVVDVVKCVADNGDAREVKATQPSSCAIC